MFDKHRPSMSDLRRARDEFTQLLGEQTKEGQWQKFFSDNPYVLSMSLPLRLEPQDIIPMGRPGRSEPDFIFFTRNFQPLPTYGVIEIKKPESKILTLTRSNVAILSRDAETAIQQAADYSEIHCKYGLEAKQDSILFLGNRAHLFVIMGVNIEFSRKLGLELYKEMLERRLPPNLKLIPFDTLLRSFEARIPGSLHILVPAVKKPSLSPRKDNALGESIARVLLQRGVEALPTAYRIIFVLHDIEGYGTRQIAAMTGASIKGVKEQLDSARLRLKDKLSVLVAESPEITAKWTTEARRRWGIEQSEGKKSTTPAN